MFLKNNNKLESLVGSNSEFKGDVTTQGTLRIDGNFNGNVMADWVILGGKSSFQGEIKARNVVIGGRVDGNIFASECVDIKSSGQLFGDIHTRKLSIAEGGLFEGRSHIHKDDTKVIDFPGKEATAK
ncbi:MAG: polymer-forming cytoskeletal protein [Thermodesulfovibrionales bacterium]|nr:polymer-forming cytoskeletal protein [Thermodesulfovibrionales bacterium]